MKRAFFYSGDRISDGMTNLRTALAAAGHRALRLKAEGSEFRADGNKVIINWGTSNGESQRLSRGGISRVLNNPANVAEAVRKDLSFNTMLAHDVAVPPFVNTWAKAKALLVEGKVRIYARTKLTGSGGEGIVLIIRNDDPAVLNNANFGNVPTWVVTTTGNHFTSYNVQNLDVMLHSIGNCQLFTVGRIGKRSEYRIHVFNNEVIHQSVKLRRNRDEGEDARNNLVRNLENGWIYANVGRDDVPQNVIDNALKAVRALKLDFGAVDILYYDETRNNPATSLVLEVNTAPGLAPESSALKAYTDAIIKFLGE